MTEIENFLDKLYKNSANVNYKRISNLCLNSNKKETLKTIKEFMKINLNSELVPIMNKINELKDFKLDIREMNSHLVEKEQEYMDAVSIANDVFESIRKFNNRNIDFLKEVRNVFRCLSVSRYFLDRKVDYAEAIYKKILYNTLKGNRKVIRKSLALALLYSKSSSSNMNKCNININKHINNNKNIINTKLVINDIRWKNSFYNSQEESEKSVSETEKLKKKFDYLKTKNPLLYFIGLLNSFGMKNSFLEKIEGYLKEHDYFMTESRATEFQFIASYFEQQSAICPPRFHRSIERYVLNRIYINFDESIILEKLNNHSELEYIYNNYKKAGLLSKLIEIYRKFLEIKKGDNFEINFYKVYLLNKIILRSFVDEAFERVMLGYYKDVVVSDDMVEWVEVIVKRSINLCDTMSGIWSIIEAVYNKENEFKIEIKSDRHVECIYTCGRECNECINGYECVYDNSNNDNDDNIINDNTNDNTNDNDDNIDNITNDNDYTIKKPKLIRNLKMEKFIRISIFKMIAFIIENTNDQEYFLLNLQINLANRLLSGKANLTHELEFIRILKVQHAERMVCMAKNVKLMDTQNTTMMLCNNNPSVKVLLMTFCKWPIYKTENLEIQEISKFKEIIENKIKSERKKISWFDSLSKATIQIFGCEITVTLFQYSILCKFKADTIMDNLNLKTDTITDTLNDTNSSLEFSVESENPVLAFKLKKSDIKIQNCYKTQFNLLLENKLIIENKEYLYLNNNFNCKGCFIPSAYQLQSIASKEDSTEDAGYKEIHFEARIARIIKNNKSIEMAELRKQMEDIDEACFKSILASLEDRGFLEIVNGKIVYAP